MIIERLYRFLDIGETPRKSDCIFVLAGMHERKPYGIDLWRQGYARELILSVGRFEWRRFYTLGLPDDGGLRKLVNATPPQKRHFLVRLHDAKAEAILIAVSRPGTMTEGRVLAAQLRREKLRSLMVVSSPFHLRRVALVFQRVFRGSGTDLIFVAVPEDRSSIRQADLGKVKTARTAVWTEFRKYLYYRFFLLGILPPFRRLPLQE